MRKLILFNMVTLDGFFAGSDGAIDWHVVDDEFHAFGSRQLDSVDTILFGRVIYQMMACYWPTEVASKRVPIIAAQMNQIAKIVFSTTLERAQRVNTRLLTEKAAEEVSRLKQLPGGDIIFFGSANLAATLTQNRLIDEYRIMVCPVVLGSGRPLFQGVERTLPMKLLDTRAFRSGNVLLVYQPI